VTLTVWRFNTPVLEKWIQENRPNAVAKLVERGKGNFSAPWIEKLRRKDYMPNQDKLQLLAAAMGLDTKALVTERRLTKKTA
jgi:hypothetical protein